MSDIIIGLTLVFKLDNIDKKSKPNQIEMELLIEKSNRNRSKSIKLNRNITTYLPI